LPELLIRNQNQLFFNAERLFTSVEKAWNSGLKVTGDYKELCPEFYSKSYFLVNLTDMLAVGDEPLNHVELPEWGSNPETFVEIMRDALESDFVSANLNKWIDLVFGFQQKVENVFPDTCYGVNWGTMKTGLVKDAFEALCREFGQFPDQLFFVPHPERVFRKCPEINPPPLVPDQGPLLEKYLNSLQESHQQRINSMLDQYSKSKKAIELGRRAEMEALNKQILQMKEMIQKTLEENSLDEDSGLQSQGSQEIIKSKSPNLAVKPLPIGLNDGEFSKNKVDAVKKPRKVQSKTPTKNF
jgi:hypothetical protein